MDSVHHLHMVVVAAVITEIEADHLVAKEDLVVADQEVDQTETTTNRTTRQNEAKTNEAWKRQVRPRTRKEYSTSTT